MTDIDIAMLRARAQALRSLLAEFRDPENRDWLTSACADRLEAIMTEFELLEAMTVYGGSFVQKLAELILLADPVNKRILLEAFPEYIEQYTELARLKANHD
jgi:hypothetical protein